MGDNNFQVGQAEFLYTPQSSRNAAESINKMQYIEQPDMIQLIMVTPLRPRESLVPHDESITVRGTEFPMAQ